MMMNKICIFISLFFTQAALLAQRDIPLEWQEVRLNILRNHPIARSAALLEREATANLLRARGGFDPKAFAEYTSKDFKGKHYYGYAEAGIKVPTWAGLELKSTYNIARGNFLNPERTLPENGQAALGFNWTLGQGLLIDERRANLRQAKIGIEQNAADRDGILLDLVLEGAKAYWDWVLYNNQLLVTDAAQRQALLRLVAVRESYLRGDKPALDTLEAFIQVQNRQIDRGFALADAQKSTMALQYFYWKDPQTPIDTATLKDAPQLITGRYPIAPNTDSLIAEVFLRHPDLRLYNTTAQMLGVERKLKLEKRKPVLDLNYSILGSAWSFFPTTGVTGGAVLFNDIKWGIDLSYPILNRKAKGDLQLTDLKINKVELKIVEKRLSIETKIRQYCNALTILSTQAATYRAMVENYRLLLEAENEKFRFGESSVFLINTREQKWLEAQFKYLKLLAEYRETEAALQWAAGAM